MTPLAGFLESSERLLAKLRWRLIPRSMEHWREDILAEARAMAWDLFNRGVHLSERGMRFVVLQALARHSRYARDLPGALAGADEIEPADRAWCLHKLSQRWHLLTSKQQEAVFALLTSGSRETWTKHGLNYRIALAKLSLGREGYGKPIRNTKLDWDAICAARETGLSPHAVAGRFGCSVSMVYHALKQTRVQA